MFFRDLFGNTVRNSIFQQQAASVDFLHRVWYTKMFYVAEWQIAMIILNQP